MLALRRNGLAALLGVALGAAACGPTEPNISVQLDTEAAMADYEALAMALESSELAGFWALADRTPFGDPTAMGVIAALDAAATSDGGRSLALALLRHAAAGIDTGPDAAPIISDTHRGRTFVYDAETDDYAVDPERTGAPETGVRFVMYQLDEAGFPIPEEEIGYTDLIDEGDRSAEDIALRLMVVVDEATVLDYRTTLDENENRGALTVRGFLVGDGVHLDFDIEAVGTERDGVQALDLAFDLRVDARDFSIVGAVSGIEDDEDGNGEIDVTVRHRDASIRVDVEGIEGEMDGTIFLNGDIFATVTGPGDDPTILGQAGEPLTFGELLVLRQIFDTLEDVFDFLEDLLDPVDEIVILGVIL